MLVEFTNALRYLDLGKFEKGGELLVKALEKAEEQGLKHESISISCCYGQLLFELGRQEEAEQYLKAVVNHHGEDHENQYEYEIALELLEKLSAK